MPQSVNILAVAPYEGLAAVLEREARLFDDVHMTVVVGNLEEGVEVAIEHLTEPFDLILSRGGTADLLRDRLDLPVVDVKTSPFDVLQAVQLSEGIQGKRAVVGFSGITDAARSTSDVLDLGLDIFTLVDESDLHTMIEPLRRDGYATVLCDVISGTVFRENGFNTVLVTSGQTSVRESIDEAVRIARHMRQAHEENVYLREVIRNSGIDTVIFNDRDLLVFTTLDHGGEADLMAYLRELLPQVRAGEADAVRKTIGGSAYAIRTYVAPQYGGDVTFYLTRSRTQSASRQAGITSYTKRDARTEYLDSPYSLMRSFAGMGTTIEEIVASGRPLLFTGEYGTGRTAMAAYAYTNTRLSSRPLVEIDCGMLTDRSREYLLAGRTSPLFESGLTIHIKNMDASEGSFIRDLFSSIVETGAAQRDYLIFSCDPRGELVGSYISYIKDKFQCMEIELPPLRESKERIPTLARLYLSQLGADLPKEVNQIDRQAMALLTDYAWPGNYIQFKRILSQLCLVSRDHTIRASDVRGLLALERPVYRRGGEQGLGTELDLDRPLAQIERDVADIVVRRNGGNQSAAARQLGISRTTLWRLTKD